MQLLIPIANSDENEDKLTEVINSMYRAEILNKEFNSIDEYVKEWGKFQNKFLDETDSYKKYEVWCKFSQEKIQDGCSKMERKVEMKKVLKEKQMAVEIDKYKTMLELKETDNSQVAKLESELNNLRNDKVQVAKREQDLKEEVIAWRELLDSKDEEIDILNEKFNNLRRQRDELSSQPNPNAKQNIRKDHILIEDTGKSATCSSNDCVIF